MSLSISYAPFGVSFNIQDALTEAASEHIVKLFPEADLGFKATFMVLANNEVKCDSVYGKVRDASKYTDIIAKFLESNLDLVSYQAGSQTFLTNMNKSTYEQNVIPLTPARASDILDEALRNPSGFKHSVTNLEYLVNMKTGEIIFEQFRNPDQYSKFNYREEVISLPSVCLTKAGAKKFFNDTVLKSSSGAYLILDATDTETLTERFIDALAEEFLLNANLRFAHVRLRGFSGPLCKQFSDAFRWVDGRFVSW